MANLFLFPEQSGEDAARHALGEKLKDLARRNIWIGTSSWKYEGWLGDIYARERYMARGHFSKKRFEETCLAEYAETFPIVCGDFSFYQFPIPSYWQKLFGLTPDNFRFAFKVPEEITVKRWPVHARYGARGGTVNESFLNAGLLDELFLKPLAPYGDRAALLVLEFGTYSKSDFASVAEFAEALDAFLAALRRRGPQPRISGAGVFSDTEAARHCARIQRLVENAGASRTDGASRCIYSGLYCRARTAARRAQL